MSEQKIPIWINIYGVVQVILVVGFGAMFFVNSEPFSANDPSWFVGVRNVGILALLLIGLYMQDAKLLFAGYLIRFLVDSGDALNNTLAGEYFNLLVFVPFLIIPLAYGSWVLWRLGQNDPK